MNSTRRPHALANILANWGTFASVALLNFFLSPYIVHHLGNSQYGLWAIIGSVLCYLGLLDLGVRSAVTVTSRLTWRPEMSRRRTV
jgi:O-antigen/teichoic acid export membrane protein